MERDAAEGVTYDEATQTMSSDPSIRFWAEVRIAHKHAGCRCNSCRPSWDALRRWLRTKVVGIARTVYAPACEHDQVHPGPDLPRLYGSWASEVCSRCGAWRTMGHANRAHLSEWKTGPMPVDEERP